jgi:hypothetical protein
VTADAKRTAQSPPLQVLYKEKSVIAVTTPPKAAGLSESMASAGLTALKRHGVISRFQPRRVRGHWEPYLTKILSPRRWVWSDGTPVLGQGVQERP